MIVIYLVIGSLDNVCFTVAINIFNLYYLAIKLGYMYAARVC